MIISRPADEGFNHSSFIHECIQEEREREEAALQKGKARGKKGKKIELYTVFGKQSKGTTTGHTYEEREPKIKPSHRQQEEEKLHDSQGPRVHTAFCSGGLGSRKPLGVNRGTIRSRMPK